MTEARAKWWRDRIELAASTMTDKDASQSAELFPELKQDGSLVKVGTRVNWHGTVKRSRADLWDTTENDPDHAPNLWEDIEYREGIRVIPQTITAEHPFSKDELGWWGDVLYRSKVNANVYTPEQYARNWETVEE